MKHLSTLCLSIVLSLAAQAQISIGQNEMPHAGDDLYRTKAVTNPFVNFNATGPAHSWDFSNLAASGPDTAEYRTVASTNFVYAIVYADLFFNPNRANHAKSGVDIAFSNFLPINNPYTFLYRSNSRYEKVGFGAEIAGIPLPIIFDEHDVIYELPINYGDQSASSSSYHLDVPVLGYYGYQQERVNEVDGWGGITTPGGTFDVLRVRTTLTIKDSIHVDTLGTGFAIDRPVVHEYKWLAQGLRVPVLQINTTTLFGFEVVNAIYYYDVPRSITVVDPLATTICPGATVDVHYGTTGAFNAGGFFVPANHFTVQLSDANGSFAAPVTIGDVTATGAGTITVTIPANMPTGSGYRIRVVSNSPAYTGADNGEDITIGGSTTASITAGGPSLICTGDTLLLTAVGGPSYQWRVDGNAIADATDATFQVTGAGVYTVNVDNACGSAVSNAITVEVNEPPTQTVDQSSYLICAGSEVSFTAHDASGQSPLTYQWFLNNAPVVGATDSTISATLGGIYTAEVTNGNTGCAFTTPEVVVNVESVPAPELNGADSTAFCDGGSAELSVVAAPGNTYQWYADGNAIAGAVDPTLSVSTAGSYSVVATSSNNCASDASDAIVVSVNALPEAPSITPSEPTSFCAGGGVTLIATNFPDVTYQWSQNGNAIPGADAAQITVSEAGSYTVMVSNGDNCTATTDPAIEVVVYPLPTTPAISQNSDMLLADGVGTFQWFLEGNAIAGATEATYQPEVNGTYTVTVTDANGCSSTSEPFVFISTGVAEHAAVDARIVPNPSSGSFFIEVPAAHGEVFEIMDATGKRVGSGRLSGSRTIVDLSAQGEGMYFVRVLHNGSTPVLRIIIAR